MLKTIKSIGGSNEESPRLGKRVSFMALAIGDWNFPIHTGGSDYLYTYRVIDENYTPNDELLRVRVFSPTKENLPKATNGDVIMVKNGKTRIERENKYIVVGKISKSGFDIKAYPSDATRVPLDEESQAKRQKLIDFWKKYYTGIESISIDKKFRPWPDRLYEFNGICSYYRVPYYNRRKELSLEIGMVQDPGDDLMPPLKLRIKGEFQKLREIFQRLQCGSKYTVNGATLYYDSQGAYSGKADIQTTTLRKNAGMHLSIIEKIESKRVALADLKVDDEPKDVLCQIMKYSVNREHCLVYVWDGTDFPVESNVLTMFEDCDSRNYAPGLEYHGDISWLSSNEYDAIYNCGSLVPLSLDPFVTESMLPRKSWVLLKDVIRDQAGISQFDMNGVPSIMKWKSQSIDGILDYARERNHRNQTVHPSRRLHSELTISPNTRYSTIREIKRSTSPSSYKLMCQIIGITPAYSRFWVKDEQFIMRLQLRDYTGQLGAWLCGEDAKTFFRVSVPPNSEALVLLGELEKVCGRLLGDEANDSQDVPWLEVYLCTFRKPSSIDGIRRLEYRVSNTVLTQSILYISET